MPTGRLAGRVALITGAARGQGAAEAAAFVREGARVVLGDVLDDACTATAEALGDAAIAVHLDVRSEADWRGAVDAAQTRLGGLHALVNNAGIGSAGGGPAPVDAVEPDAFREVLDVNLVGNFLGIRACAGALRESAEALRATTPEAAHATSAIVNVSSAQAFRPSAQNAAYASSKWAQRGLTRVAALDLAPLVRVNAVMPGPIRTPMIEPLLEAGGEILQRVVDGVPLGRIGDPEDVADVVLFLCSEESRYCTGGEFPVEGGRVAGT